MTGIVFGESPRWHDDRLWFSDWGAQELIAVDLDAREAGRLAGIPGVIVQGKLDLGNLLGTPWELAYEWPDCQLVLVDDAGHGSGEPGMLETLVAATDRFAPR